MVKNPLASIGDTSSIPGSGRSSGEGHGNPLQYPSHGQRSWAGCTPCGHKESDLTEQPSTHTHGIVETTSLGAGK